MQKFLQLLTQNLFRSIVINLTNIYNKISWQNWKQTMLKTNYSLRTSLSKTCLFSSHTRRARACSKKRAFKIWDKRFGGLDRSHNKVGVRLFWCLTCRNTKQCTQNSVDPKPRSRCHHVLTCYFYITTDLRGKRRIYSIDKAIVLREKLRV